MDLRTTSAAHLGRQPRICIQNDVLVGEMATTTPGPVHPRFPVVLLCLHIMTVSPAWTLSVGCVRGRVNLAACNDLVVFCRNKALCAADLTLCEALHLRIQTVYLLIYRFTRRSYIQFFSLQGNFTAFPFHSIT